MMAGLVSQDREQFRVDKVSIIHAGEDLEQVLRPLAGILEKSLKLGEQAEYVRKFRSDTDIADYVWKSINRESCQESWRFVVIISDRFVYECSKHAAVYQNISSKLRSPNPSRFALVSPSDKPAQWLGSRCIDLSTYVQGLEGGNLAEAILQQWFGPQAMLPTQAEARMKGPDKVKVIHAMTDPEDRQKYWGKVVTAIEEVANPENTTQARLHFKQDCSVARMLLSDLEKFSKCAVSENINAVILWCKNMLNVLNQDPLSKAKIVDIICNDTKQQKTYAHFLFGVDSQQMRSLSQRLWNHLAHYGHMAYIEPSQLRRPNIDYTPFAQLFLSYWTGCKEEIRGPVESIDPSLTSLETSLEGISLNVSNGEVRSGVSQFHPDQDQDRANIVLNGESMDYGKACDTQQMALALRSDDSLPQDRLVTNKDSWPNNLAACASKSRESQSDGASNPPRTWSGLKGSASMQEGQQARRNPSSGVVSQPVPGSCGQNKMTAGSIGSVPVDSVQGSKMNGVRGGVPLNRQTMAMAGQDTPSRGTISLPAGAAGGQIMAQAHQPVTQGCGINIGQNRIAASGFSSHSTAGQFSSFSTGQEISSEGIISGHTEEASSQLTCTLSTQPCGPLSAQQNPVRFVSDENLDQQLDAGIQHLPVDQISDRPTTGQPQSLQFYGSGTEEDASGTSLTTSHSMPVIPFRMDCQDIDPSFPADGANSVQNGESPSADQGEIDSRNSTPVSLSSLSVQIKRGLRERLDPLRPAIYDWRDLASHFKVPPVKINYWKSLMSGTFSPTEQLIDWLVTKNNDFTVVKFRDGLKTIERNDVCKFLDKELAHM